MTAEGILSKMSHKIHDGEVKYSLSLGGQEIDMNSLLGKEIGFTFLNKINCTICGTEIKQAFQGRAICRHCYLHAPEAEECLFYPEKCMAHLGEARDMKWSEENCLIPHFVYLAVSSGLKVGVTRYHQIPFRWIDQGAVRAIKLAETPNRHIAGVIENFLKDHLADKTNWKKMLMSVDEDFEIDLLKEKGRASALLPGELQKYISDDDAVTEIKYPGINIPGDLKIFGFDKENEIRDTLTAIKGQYLIFAGGQVFNMNRYSGYNVLMTY